MADKKYKLIFALTDGTEQSVEFAAPQGEPGYTPVKGVDYFTEADKEEIVALVLAALNPPEVLSVTLSEETYQFEEGMTWEQWVESDYNTGGYAICNTSSYGVVISPDGGESFIQYAETLDIVLPQEEISAEKSYVVDCY